MAESIDGRANVKVKNEAHEKMKKISKKNNRILYEEYDLAIKDYIQKHEEKELLKDSQLEEIVRKYHDKLDKHLSGMIAADGMRTSSMLAGLVRFFSSYYDVEASILYEQMKKEGLEIFTNKDLTFLKNTNNEY